MGMLCIGSNVVLKAIIYSRDSSELRYFFVIEGIEKDFFARAHDNSGIRGIEYSDELDNFIMSLMPLDSDVSKKLCACTWSFIDEREGRVL